MPIDPSIPLRVQTFKPQSQGNMLAQLMALKQATSQNALAEYQMGRTQKADAREEANRAAVAGAVGPDGTVDYTKLRGAVAGTGDLNSLMSIDKFQTDQAKTGIDTDKSKIELAIKKLDAKAQLLGSATDQASWDAATQQAEQLGLIQTGGQRTPYDPANVEKLKMMALSAKEQLEAQARQATATETNRHNRASERTADYSARNKSEPLVEIYDAASPTGSRMVPRGQAAGQPGKPSSKMSLTYDEQGRPIIDIGGAGPTKSTENEIGKRQLNAVDALDRLSQVEKSFDPSFLTYGGKLKDITTNLQDKAGIPLSPDDQAFQQKYTEFAANTAGNLNATLKELSGTAVNASELPRMEKQLPSEKDGPQKFKAKLDVSTKNFRRAIIRYRYATQIGIDPLKSGIELADVDKLIERRGHELEQSFMQDKTLSPKQIEGMVTQQLKSEFGQ